MDRQTRHQLKHDEFKDTLVSVEEYFKNHYKEIINIAIIVVVVLGLAAGLKFYTDRQEAERTPTSVKHRVTFRASARCQSSPGQNDPEGATYPTAQDKYKKALQQFDAILDKYKMPPRPEAVAIARHFRQAARNARNRCAHCGSGSGRPQLRVAAGTTFPGSQ